MSIMIVDDNPVNLIVIEKILKSAGYSNMHRASSAMELFDMLKIDNPSSSDLQIDLILMDLMMPEIDGIEACKKLQQIEELKDIPIIIITAMGDSIKLAEALEAGAIDYVTKPINKIELVARIKSALRLKYEKDWHKENDKRIRSELQLAKNVQSSVLSLPIETEKIRIEAYYNPSYELAGDLYNWYPIDEDRYGVMLLDIMGHGISSSLVCMFISSVLRDTITKFVTPELVIAELNRYMNRLHNDQNHLNYYFTAIYMLVDTKNKTIDYVNAGHPPGFLMNDSGKAIPLANGTCAVGFFEEMDIKPGRITYTGKSRILLYTDGLLEEIEEAETELPTRLITAVQQKGDMGLHAVVDELLDEEVQNNHMDDICLIWIDIP
ncbi:fused response regulator/phosphatase [Paenibacillus chitinolyticus]|uniref:Fused response regulator/phosphatase n=1 Tax=Paenibacillus chitinolyticus TaxID=79263 RepID=A0A410WVJ8_9BACL|nr:fused response regulator/phosphatase [Paenibacillus chitinolyticus]MCY9589305.1 fused response regulator/phosphatase [Paenibacillus chitinolyticus]MCY9594378.1 fused response regulator/phosphatase [Paenibacillus chitinolyticus]QAV18372.1 fused response regulator/phosphatase [Paenibacillus chitinolyticus]